MAFYLYFSAQSHFYVMHKCVCACVRACSQEWQCVCVTQGELLRITAK